MNDVCSTDFVRVNLNKLIVVVVEIVLRLATCNMEICEVRDLVTLKICSYFLFFNV